MRVPWTPGSSIHINIQPAVAYFDIIHNMTENLQIKIKIQYFCYLKFNQLVLKIYFMLLAKAATTKQVLSYLKIYCVLLFIILYTFHRRVPTSCCQ